MANAGSLSIGCTIGGKSESALIAASAGGESIVDEVVANGQTDYTINTYVPAAPALFQLISDRAVTVKTNSNSSPGNTWVLVAHQPLIWFTGALWANPLAAAITSLHVANASGAAANLVMMAVYDGSP